MVKFGKNKLKTLNKAAKKQSVSSNSTNKVLKKQRNAEKKVTFQKEVLLKEAVTSNTLVKKVSNKETLESLLLKPENSKPKVHTEDKKSKVKSVEKHKKRQKMQINDTKLLLSLMKKK